MNEKILEAVAKATKIYYGLDHHCRCGCGGRYAQAGERTFKTYVTRIRKAVTAGDIREPEVGFRTNGSMDWVNIPVGLRENDKCYSLYFD